MRIIHGRSEHKTVCRFRFLDPFVDTILREYAFALIGTTVTADTVLHGLISDLQYFRFDPLFVEYACNFRKGGKSTAFCSRTSVKK